MENATGSNGSSISFNDYILTNLGENETFTNLIEDYSQLKLSYSFERDEFPELRFNHKNTKDLIWIAASNSKNIDDFSERIIGYLPHKTHVSLIETLKKAEPFYNSLIWEKEQKNIKRIEGQLSNYKDEIADVFKKVSQFYGSNWSTEIPFKVMLYPIPLENGYTTAIPKGNALICNFLSRNEQDYKNRLGVIIHEMCHILFDAQSPELQKEIDQAFLTSDSKYARLTYSYIDEGLATVLGNGWAHEQINGSMDTLEWYNDVFIDGFAHSLFPMTKKFLTEGKQIDSKYIKEAINLFGKTFPNATKDVYILLNSCTVYMNSESEDDINSLYSGIFNNFNVRSLSLITPMIENNTIENLDKIGSTKVFIINSDHAKTIKALNRNIPDIELSLSKNSFTAFQDEDSKSTLIFFNIDDFSKWESGLNQLANIRFLEYNKNYIIE